MNTARSTGRYATNVASRTRPSQSSWLEAGPGWTRAAFRGAAAILCPLPDPFNFLGDVTALVSFLFSNSVVECSVPRAQGCQLNELAVNHFEKVKGSANVPSFLLMQFVSCSFSSSIFRDHFCSSLLPSTFESEI